jgi:hypothetical protein
MICPSARMVIWPGVTVAKEASGPIQFLDTSAKSSFVIVADEIMLS